ncbi:outer-membrane lipoprotein carrier protein LolA [Candidatus Pelagibacter sp.]|nr:outer-membrane lipoprotein carrier protein LolA [Candidatus Pelagibacter sp.]
MINKIFFLFLLFSVAEASANIKEKIIQNLFSINNLTFNFEQNVNGKTENGRCILSYPKKIFCEYNLKNGKVLVSNGKSIVIKTKSSYYLYPLERTPLNLILNKDFLIKKIKNLNERIIDNKFINFKFYEEDFELNIFFDYSTLDLIGWQTIDIYQNLSITFLDSIKKNQQLSNKLFILPQQN